MTHYTNIHEIIGTYRGSSLYYPARRWYFRRPSVLDSTCSRDCRKRRGSLSVPCFSPVLRTSARFGSGYFFINYYHQRTVYVSLTEYRVQRVYIEPLVKSRPAIVLTSTRYTAKSLDIFSLLRIYQLDGRRTKLQVVSNIHSRYRGYSVKRHRR